jgi:hypothetical protein
MPPGLLTGLSSINPEVFTVSSIFSQFERGRFASTFTAATSDGSKPDIGEITELMDHLSQYYMGIREEAEKAEREGLPNPDTPFVLGYGLMQNIQHIQDINPGASWEDTPAYFIPANYDMTTTKGSSDNSNTLNYCMMTHTTKNYATDNPRKINNDETVGNLQTSFCDLLKTSAGDGVMAWSSGIFWGKWILGVLAPCLYIEPTPIVGAFLEGRGIKDVTWTQWDDQVNAPGTLNILGLHPDMAGKNWWRHTSYKTRTYGQDGNAIYNAEAYTEGELLLYFSAAQSDRMAAQIR